MGNGKSQVVDVTSLLYSLTAASPVTSMLFHRSLPDSLAALISGEIKLVLRFHRTGGSITVRLSGSH
jgi:hypothetical protein